MKKMKKTLLLATLLLTFIVSAQEAYYSDVDLTTEGLTLKDELAVKTIRSHTKTLSYGWPALQATDVNPENSNEVLLIYGYSASGTTARTSGVNNICSSSCPDGSWNREHVYAKSLGNPNLGTSGPGADGHHLRPSDVSFNSQRSNLKFADGSGNAGSVSGGWYPGDEWKGDVARIIMYMYIRYGDQCKPTGVGIGNDANAGDDMIDLFLEWNAEDPVSDFERQRNTYHTSGQSYSQGNRNPFIDNAYLATRIWGGTPAQDYWGIYTSTDDEAPTVPTNVTLNTITVSTINATWTASTDNEGVNKYEIYANGVLNGESTTTNYTVVNLAPNTAYAITVLAKDIANNKSAQSTAANATTLADTTAPSTPTNVTISSETGTSFKASWFVSTDNAKVKGYDVYVDGTLNGSTTTETNYTVTGLTISTTYSVTVLAKDAANNKSDQSAPVNATTTDGTAPSNELFFSEYIEGNSNNKAIEIANFTGTTVSLADYSVKLASNGQDFGTQTLTFTNETIANEDVFVIGNSSISICTSEIDISSNVTYFGGNDVLGLFKNDVLIDIIGKEGDTNNFGQNVTLKRKPSITYPNAVYDANEWIETPMDDCSDLGKHNLNTASVGANELNTFKIYPNPVENKLYINTNEDVKITIYNVLGKLVQTTEVTSTKKDINVANLSSGIYLVKINNGAQSITKKMIKN